MIDPDGFRANVGIIICNDAGQVFWAKRINQNAWQFPQGGIRKNESHEQAMFRELREETGLKPHHVEIIGVTQKWLRYRLPKRLVRHHTQPVCIGQKQRWYAVRLVGNESKVQLNNCENPEFDGWRWVDYGYPSGKVVSFKRKVYQRALQELKPLIKPQETAAQNHSPGT